MNLAERIVDIILETDEENAELAAIIRQSGVAATPEDFEVNSYPARFGKWSTGNYYFSISYKPIQVNGRPLYLGLVMGTHDYNRTQSTSLTDYHIVSTPSWTTQHTGLKPGVKGKSPFKGGPKTRTHYGHRGIVAFDNPAEHEHEEFKSWFDAAKYLLTLVRRNPRLKFV